MSRPPPAAAAAGPIAVNTPAPIIDPRPMIVASEVPSRRDSRLGGSVRCSVIGQASAVADRSRVARSGPGRLEQLDEVAVGVLGQDL